LKDERVKNNLNCERISLWTGIHTTIIPGPFSLQNPSMPPTINQLQLKSRNEKTDMIPIFFQNFHNTKHLQNLHVTIANQDHLLCKNFKIQTSQINELKLEKPSTDMSQISEKKLPSHSLQSHPKKTSITLHERGGGREK